MPVPKVRVASTGHWATGAGHWAQGKGSEPAASEAAPTAAGAVVADELPPAAFESTFTAGAKCTICKPPGS